MIITCFSNDYGYERWMEKAIEFYGENGDILFLVSVSGKSKIVKSSKSCTKEKFSKIVTFTGHQRITLKKLEILT